MSVLQETFAARFGQFTATWLSPPYVNVLAFPLNEQATADTTSGGCTSGRSAHEKTYV